MKIHHYIPRPGFAQYVCFPDSFGRYYDFPEHREHRPQGQLTEFNLHLVFDGRGTVIREGKEHTLLPGHGFLYGPGSEQEYGTAPEEPWDVRWIHFYGDSVERLLGGRSRGQMWLFSFSNAERLLSLTDDLMAIGAAYATAREPRVSAILYEILMELLANTQPVHGSTLPDSREKIRTTADFIRNHCTEPLTLEQMATVAGYSPFHFSRQFHRVMGKTPVAFLIESRILYAKRLLATSGWTVKRIASEAGFSQCSYFITQFRRHVRMTPEEFRRLYGFRSGS